MKWASVRCSPFRGFSNAIKSDGSLFNAVRTPVSGTDCQKSVDQAIVDYCGGYNDYSLKYHKLVVNACMQPGEKIAETLIQTFQDLCSQMKKPLQF